MVENEDAFFGLKQGVWAWCLLGMQVDFDNIQTFKLYCSNFDIFSFRWRFLHSRYWTRVNYQKYPHNPNSKEIQKKLIEERKKLLKIFFMFAWYLIQKDFNWIFSEE